MDLKTNLFGKSNSKELTSFDIWYREFRNEIIKNTNVSYGICIASYTFQYDYKHYFDAGYNPIESAIDFLSKNNKLNN